MNEIEQDELRRREIAARVSARADIVDIRTLKISAQLESQPTQSHGLIYSMSNNVEAEYEEGDSHFVVSVSYSIDIEESLIDPEGGNESEQMIARISFAHAALFSLEIRASESPPTAEEVEAFASTTGQFALYPYAREFVSMITARLGLPALTIPMFKLATRVPKP